MHFKGLIYYFQFITFTKLILANEKNVVCAVDCYRKEQNVAFDKLGTRLKVLV